MKIGSNQIILIRDNFILNLGNTVLSNVYLNTMDLFPHKLCSCNFNHILVKISSEIKIGDHTMSLFILFIF